MAGSEENRYAFENAQFSYRSVLHSENRIGHIDKMASFARELGYPYFLWNDRLFSVGDKEYIDTGYTVKDILLI